MQLTLSPFFCHLRRISNLLQTESENEKKNKVTGLVAEQSASYDIQNAYEAAKYRECVEPGVSAQHNQVLFNQTFLL